jgi:ferredoxin
MPKISFKGSIIECKEGSNLRAILLRNNLSLYNGVAKYINCRGLGTCGTCALKIKGEVSPLTPVEKWRLNFPPHRESAGLRLACQCKVKGDLNLEKGRGLWGQKI